MTYQRTDFKGICPFIIFQRPIEYSNVVLDCTSEQKVVHCVKSIDFFIRFGTIYQKKR